MIRFEVKQSKASEDQKTSRKSQSMKRFDKTTRGQSMDYQS